jgi:hypothetical protein
MIAGTKVLATPSNSKEYIARTGYKVVIFSRGASGKSRHCNYEKYVAQLMD